MVDTDGKCGGKGLSASYSKDDSFASFSTFGGAVEISAPGANLYSTHKGASHTTMTGTSIRLHLTWRGAATLYKDVNPLTSPSEVLGKLLKLGCSSIISLPSNSQIEILKRLDQTSSDTNGQLAVSPRVTRKVMQQ